MSSETVLRLRPDELAWREFEGEAVLLDLRTSVYLATNPTATLLWRQLDGGTTESAMAATLVEAFDIPAARAAADVARFIADCRARNLLA
ncbi:MAG: hypothetical protein QOH46_2836 [Solirubrobacteraceae bacterium]|nr:hypothetical protein [Solirubrobacteraceae bacterium]